VTRREFITLLGGGPAVAWPLGARAQQTAKLARIGFLTLATGPTPAIRGFQHGLQQLGYVEGQNLVLIYRWAAGRRDRLADLTSELLQLNVDVIASNSTEAILAVRDLNKNTPVVMVSISDPIGNNLVAGFARPGGNTTGVTLFSTELAGKRLELLKEVVPHENKNERLPALAADLVRRRVAVIAASSLVQLRSAVWTGDTRDTRP
jgi:putative ABC transport system substrate-binding protein